MRRALESLVMLGIAYATASLILAARGLCRVARRVRRK